MSVKALRALIDSLTQDIDFSYHGVTGSICPFSRQDIALCYEAAALQHTGGIGFGGNERVKTLIKAQ